MEILEIFILCVSISLIHLIISIVKGQPYAHRLFCITRANERKGDYYGNQSYKQSISLNERLAVIKIDEKILVGKYVIL